MPNFERYEPQASTTRPEGAALTITRRGELSLSADSVHLLRGAERVTLLWDSDEQLLGIEPTEDGAHRVLATRQTGRSRNISNARQFLDWAGIGYETARRWSVEDRYGNGLLVVDLSTPGEDVTSNRAQQPTTRIDTRSGARSASGTRR